MPSSGRGDKSSYIRVHLYIVITAIASDLRIFISALNIFCAITVSISFIAHMVHSAARPWSRFTKMRQKPLKTQTETHDEMHKSYSHRSVNGRHFYFQGGSYGVED